MDTSDMGISFDDKGICNHCHSYDEMTKYFPNVDNTEELEKVIRKIKSFSKDKKYDCLIGLSGGMDSSYVVYLAYIYKLRPLLVHLDNGWDAELAMDNVRKIVEKTGFDLLDYKIDFNEFIQIQKAYFEANVIDVEVPSDLAIISVINKTALKYNIKYILSGLNMVTEFTIGKDWNYSKTDRANFNAIVKTKNVELKTFPYYSPKEQLLYKIKDIKTINLLQYINYDVFEIERELKDTFDWNNYAVKHGESVFTLFYQTYYLPQKFDVDKRKAHLSDLIRSGNITREEALNRLQGAPLTDKQKEEMIANVLDKLHYSKEEFKNILLSKPVSHRTFPHDTYYGNIDDRIYEFILSHRKVVTALKLLHKQFYND